MPNYLNNTLMIKESCQCQGNEDKAPGMEDEKGLTGIPEIIDLGCFAFFFRHFSAWLLWE